MERDPEIDTIVLGCTHYPMLIDKIRLYAPEGVNVLAQGDLVARSLASYLERHPEMERRLSRGSTVEYMTTESTEKFDGTASLFMGTPVKSVHVAL